MARGLQAEDIASMVNEPEWDNSDASSDEDEYFSLLGLALPDPLQRAEDSGDSDDDPHHTQSINTCTYPLQEAELPRADSGPTSPSGAFS